MLLKWLRVESEKTQNFDSQCQILVNWLKFAFCGGEF